MNAAMTVGLTGPAPPATGTSPPADAGTGEAAPFATVLQGTDRSGSDSVRTGGEPPGPEPGSLDLTALIQLLLGGGDSSGDQTMTETDQPDRLAGAGTNQTEDAGQLAAEELLVALMPQLATRPAEPAATSLVALSAAVAAAQQGDARTTSTPAGVEVLSTAVDGEGIASGPSTSGANASSVVVPAAAANADAAGTAVSEAEQQLLPLQPTGVEDGTATEPASSGATDAAGEVAPASLEAALAEAAGDEAVLEQPTADAARSELQSSGSRDSATAAKADAVTGNVVAAPQPATTSGRATTPVSATDPAATPTNTEVFTSELAGTVRRASMLGDQEVRLLLNPPELGHLDVRVVESPEGLRVVLEATSREARELIEQQLPALRTALEARDLKVERLQVEQALEPSATEEQSERGLRQDGQGESSSDQPGQDAAPWSPVAALQSDGTNEPGATAAASGSESNTRNVTGSGQLNVLA